MIKNKNKNNYFDKIKKEKFSPLTGVEERKQMEYFRKWTKDMFLRKLRGNEKYGNYMMDCDNETSIEELREEMLDVCNHLIMLTYRIDSKLNTKVKRK